MAARQNMTLWRECIRTWYPDYEKKVYFVPPVVITRIPFDVINMAGQEVLVQHPNTATVSCIPKVRTTRVKGRCVQDSDTRDDLALLQVLFCLRELASQKNEPMFIMSQLGFSSYLGQPVYAAAAKCFSRPRNLAAKYKDGDFDILIIHLEHGILAGEIKSVLSTEQHFKLSPQDRDKVVADRIRNALKQLDKSEVVLREITRDLEPKLAIHKILVLPYVTANDLIRQFSVDNQLKQDVVTCLKASDCAQAIERCLLADNLTINRNTFPSIHQFQEWWLRRFDASSDSYMSSKLYLDLLARFCGPATTVSVYCLTAPRVEVRTEGEGVATLGARMACLVLTPQQISLLTIAPPKVMLTGPPGVGKSVMLLLMALKWLRQGHDVHLVSVYNGTLAAMCMLDFTISMTMRNAAITSSAVGHACVDQFDIFNDEAEIERAICTLTTNSGSGNLYVICDEFTTDENRFVRHQKFVTDLCSQCPNVCLWVASQFHHQKPLELQEEPMTIPLRCPPAVLSEVEKGVNSFTGAVYPYATNALASPCDGPRVIHLRHLGPIHTARRPLECDNCGHSIAGILQRLGIGVTNTAYRHANASTPRQTSIATTSALKSQTLPNSPLQYRDVFVLYGLTSLHDDVTDDTGHKTLRSKGVVGGLRAAGVPVRVIKQGHTPKDLYEVAASGNDAVTVTYYGVVSGLERKVVVCLPHGRPGDEWAESDLLVADRLYSMSRCTSQLVVIDVPLQD